MLQEKFNFRRIKTHRVETGSRSDHILKIGSDQNTRIRIRNLGYIPGLYLYHGYSSAWLDGIRFRKGGNLITSRHLFTSVPMKFRYKAPLHKTGGCSNHVLK